MTPVFRSWGDRFRYGAGRFLSVLFLQDSRKVGFGMWVFITATVLIVIHRIDGNQWITCVGMSTVLIGGGTLGDKWLGKKEDKVAPSDPSS